MYVYTLLMYVCKTYRTYIRNDEFLCNYAV